MRHTTDPKLTLVLGYALVLGILCANTVVLSSNMNTVTHNRELVGLSHDVTDELSALLSLAADAETGQRGFLLTGQNAYLEPYNAALADIHGRLSRLQELTKDDIRQHRRIADLGKAIDAKLAELKATIQLRKNGGESAARPVVLSGRGKAEMKRIRTLIGQMASEEQTLLAARELESLTSERDTRVTFAGATIACILLLVIVYRVTARADADRRRSAEVLQKREEWLATLLRSIGDAVIATDANGAVLFMNSIAEQLTGWTQTDAVGKDAELIFTIVNEATRANVTSPIRQVLQENRIVALANHTVLIAKGGSETFIDDSAAPIHDAVGRLIGVVLVFRDISERKSAQDQKERNLEDMGALNSRLQRAMTETHHRVKNNLQLISGMVELLSQEGDGTLSADEVIRLGANIRTLAAVQDVLTQEARREGNVIEISTKDILEKLLPVHQQSAPRHTITAELVEVKLPGSQATALALLANELLSNAIKHGKSIVKLAMRLDATQNTLEMKVIDDGPGFAPEFDPLEAANTGLELIVNLATWDLRGELHFGNHAEGGEVRLVMPLPEQISATPNSGEMFDSNLI